jgi:AAA ATPase domain
MATSSALGVVLLTDMVESTATRVRLGTAFNRLLREHDQLISDVLSRHSPIRRTDTGDGFQATFDSATVAIDAACAIQWGVWERNESRPPAHRFEVRIVLSAGELVQRAGKLHGMALFEAARLEKKADAGEIRCTDVLRLLATEQDPALFTEPEDIAFKGFREPRRVWYIDWRLVPPGPAELQLPGPLLTRRDDLFVGRAIERARVVRNWEQAQRTGNRLVVVWGEAGIGKSALARAVANDLHQQHAWILYGRCDRDPVTPFQPFTEALATFVRDVGDSRQLLGRGSDHLRALVAEPDPVGTGPSATADPETARYELFAAIADWLATISRENGVLFVIDDLDLADEPTLELVRHVLRAQSTGNVCLLGTCRWAEHPFTAGGSGPLHDVLRLNDQVEDVPLRGLGDGELEAVLASYVGQALPAGRATASFVHELRAFTGGNPLFVNAVLSDVSDDVVAQLREGGQHPIPFGVPDDVQELFRKRRRRLAEPAQALLDAASVIGPAFQDALVTTAAGLREADAALAFSQLRRSGLLRVGQSGGHQFTHPLIHEAALRHLRVDEAVELHLRVARALEDGENPLAAAADLSRHYGASPTESHRRASADYAVIAGDRATASLAAGLAARHYRHALSMYDGLSEGLRDTDRCDLVSKLGRTLKQAGDPAADEALLHGARLACELDDAPRMARTALATLSDAWTITGGVDEAKVDVLERAVSALRDQLPALRAVLLAALAAELTFLHDPSRRTEALCKEAVELARRLHDTPPPDGDRAVLSRVLERRHTVLLHPDGLAERRTIVAELDRLSATLPPTRSFAAASNGFWTAMECGDVGECRRRLQTMREIVEVVNMPRLIALTMHWQSSLTALLGQIDDAEEAAHESGELWSTLGSRDALVFNVGLRYLPAWYRGRLGEVVDDIETCAAAYPGRIGMHAGRAHAWSVLGQRERAVAALDDVDLDGGGGHHDQLVALALTVMAARNVGDVDRLQQAHKLLAMHEDHVAFNGTACFGSVQQYLAIACGVSDEFDEADKRFHAAAESHTAMAAPALLAATKLEWATMLLRRRAPSDGVRSRVLLEEALTVAHGLGLPALEQASHRTLATVS